MTDIVLTTLNARYSHASFGLRYLMANLGDLTSRARILEFDIQQRPVDVVERILAEKPEIVGLGVYIWNVGPATEVVAILKRVAPGTLIVVGGPEVSYETEQQAICQMADYVVTGEADLGFAQLCHDCLQGRRPEPKVIACPPVDLAALALPYALYDADDIAHRVIYVEASRGCPFTCEFCLSSLDVPVRKFALETLLPQFEILLERGVRLFKFVDRTFNLSIPYSLKVLEFFRERYRLGLYLHFEMVPDRLPQNLREMIQAFPRDCMQFEIGIQTFNPEVAALIKRRQDYAVTEENIRWLRDQTDAYIHADLIFGLPGESLESFAAGFDRLVGLRPHEIQVGILKRLRGTPIVRHDDTWEMIYNPQPPYEILRNRLVDYETVQRMRRFARYWDLVANSGNFSITAPLLWANGASPFARFMAWSDWMYARSGRTHSISLVYLAQHLFEFIVSEARGDERDVARALLRDYRTGGRRDIPAFLAPHLLPGDAEVSTTGSRTELKRQARRRAAEQVPLAQ